MKNKIILNIIIVYFFIFITLIIFQLNSKEISAVEPLSIDIKTEDKLKNAVVLAIDSPITIINEKQLLIDENDATLTPKKIEGKIYIPINLLKKAYDANINFNKNTKETTIRLDNKAIIFSKNSSVIKIIYNTSKEEIMADKPKILNDRFYISLKTFANILKKETFVNNNLIIISNIEKIFDSTKEKDIINKINKKINTLPIAGSYENIKSIPINNTNNFENINGLINISNLEPLLDTQERVMIKKANGYNVYVSNEYIEIYFVKNKKETFIGKIKKRNNKILDMQMIDKNILVSYYENGTKTDIYTYNDGDISFGATIYQEGELYKNIIIDNNIISISKAPYIDKKEASPEYYTINKKGKQEIYIENFKNIQYFPNMNDNEYTLITYMNLNNIKSEYLSAKYKTYIGMGSNIIIKKASMYIFTENEKNNILYLIKFTKNGIKYINKQEVYGKFLNMAYDDNKNVLEIYLENEKQIFDKDIIRKMGGQDDR